MRLTSLDKLTPVLAGLPENPRVVAERQRRHPVDPARRGRQGRCERYTLHLLNAQPGLPRPRRRHPRDRASSAPGMRRSPRLAYVPSRLSLVPRLYRSALPPDVVVVHTSLPRDGKVSLGIEVNVLPAAIEAARARGGAGRRPARPGDALHLRRRRARRSTTSTGASRRTTPSAPRPGRPPTTCRPDRRARGGSDRRRVRPSSSASARSRTPCSRGCTGRRRLRVWSEMVSDGVLALDRAGALDRDEPLTASFLFGTDGALRVGGPQPAAAAAAHRDHQRPVSVIARHPGDGVGQHRAAGRPLRAGQRVAGARPDPLRLRRPDRLHRRAPCTPTGGQAIIALRSWHPRADVSTIVPMVDEPVTSFQPSAVVTEQGVAELWGADPGAAGPPPDRARRPPAGPRGAGGGGAGDRPAADGLSRAQPAATAPRSPSTWRQVLNR